MITGERGDGPCPLCFIGEHCGDCGQDGCDYCEA